MRNILALVVMAVWLFRGSKIQLTVYRIKECVRVSVCACVKAYVCESVYRGLCVRMYAHEYGYMWEPEKTLVVISQLLFTLCF